ncbi:bifunctional DNA methylase [Babesia duncani]|uniref:Bifunctional DNA methylase n=1 Tax=Babesia duncani TaxID=323732 RepID=A0AAD9UPY3_9APIC|nr:bifunctional DNA methylase [Babesia duncani]
MSQQEGGMDGQNVPPMAFPFDPRLVFPVGAMPPFPMPWDLAMNAAPKSKGSNARNAKTMPVNLPPGMDHVNSIPLGGSDRKSKDYSIAIKGRERLHNDYNQNFVDTGARPQNFIRDTDEEKRFREYPKLKRLLKLKREIITKRATPARYIKADLRNFDWDSLQVLFDVVLINPPWQRQLRHFGKFGWTGEDLIEYLPIDKIVEPKSFCFIWCDVYSLEEAKNCLKYWGYRRCEDICWLKTNNSWTVDEKQNGRNRMMSFDAIEPPAILHKTTEHCLMGLRGLIRRNEEGYLVHSNLDTDVIIAEEINPKRVLEMELQFNPDVSNLNAEMDSHLISINPKPAEIFDIIDRFCLGRRKLEIFGNDDSIRDGWITLSPALSDTKYNAEEYKTWTDGNVCWPEIQNYKGGRLMGTSEEIELLRPKSPTKEDGKTSIEHRD